jgi:hypothetical protein
MIAAPRSGADLVMRLSEGKMSLKLIMRRIVMAFVLGEHSVPGVGMSREKIESLMHAMNQSNAELSISNAGRGDPMEVPANTADRDPT